MLPPPNLHGTPSLRPVPVPSTPRIPNDSGYLPHQHPTTPRYPSSPPSTAAPPASLSACHAPTRPASSPIPPLPDLPVPTTSASVPVPSIATTRRRGRPPHSSHIADGQLTGAGSSGSARKTSKRKAPEPPAEPNAPAAKRSRAGRPNWRDEEIEAMLDIVEEHQPAGQVGWQRVAEDFQDFVAENPDFHPWTAQQIEDKFKNLVRKKPPTGNLNIPPHVARALDIDQQISTRFHVLEEEDSPGEGSSSSHAETDSDSSYEWSESEEDDGDGAVGGKAKGNKQGKGKAKGKGKEKAKEREPEKEKGKGKGKEGTGSAKENGRDKGKGRARTRSSNETVYLGTNPPAAPRATRASAAPPRRNRQLDPEFLTNVAASFDPSNIAARDRALVGRVEEMSRVSQLERQVKRLEDQLERMRTERNELERVRNDLDRRLHAMQLERHVLRNAAQNSHYIRYTPLPPRSPSPSGDESEEWFARTSGRESEGGTIHYPDGGMYRRACRNRSRHASRAPAYDPRDRDRHHPYHNWRPTHRYQQPSPPMRLETHSPGYGPFTPPRLREYSPPEGSYQPRYGGGPSRPLPRASAPSSLVSPRTVQAAEARGQLGVNLETEPQNGSIRLTITPSKAARPGDDSDLNGSGF
ncbi:hypothetical protein FS837_005811 [Tulasnella sp. UAMH 9824]|nr:hypothetical protein FS837_005811 [Tulasnella sp. UAMH 9824]